jgi:hypothetical protein
MGLMVIERRPEQPGQRAGLVRARARHRLQSVRGLPQARDRGVDLVPIRYGELAEPPHAVHVTSHEGGACRRCQRLCDVRFLAAERGEAFRGTLVADLLDVAEQLRQVLLDLGDGLLPLLAGVRERGRRRGQRLQAENRRQQVVHVRRLAQERLKLGVREERAVRDQCVLPGQAFEPGLPFAGCLHAHLRAAERRVRRPGAPDRRRADAFQQELGADLGRARAAQVAPPLVPHRGQLLPPLQVAGQQHLQRLGETRLAAAVPPHDEGEAGTRVDGERGPRADAAKARHRDRTEVHAGRFGLLDVGGVLGGGGHRGRAEMRRERLRTVERGEQHAVRALAERPCVEPLKHDRK